VLHQKVTGNFPTARDAVRRVRRSRPLVARRTGDQCTHDLGEAIDDLYRHDAAHVTASACSISCRCKSYATFRLGSYPSGNATRRVTEKRCGPDGETGPHHESRAKGFPHRREGFWHGSTEMSRRIAKPDHTGRTLGDMTEGRSEAEGHRRLHTRTHRRDSLSERDQVHGLARTMFVCDAPPLGRRPEHRIDRLTPIRPQMGRLLEHGVSANGLTRCMQARSAPARAECAHRRAFKVHPHCFSTHGQR